MKNDLQMKSGGIEVDILFISPLRIKDSNEKPEQKLIKNQ
jgi:hypothetical protein